MPIYEYRCEKCDSHFEVIQKFSDKPLKFCSNCKGRLTKLISQTSFQLKGSGWYVTDYANKSGASGKSNSSESESSSSSDGHKSDSKRKEEKKSSKKKN